MRLNVSFKRSSRVSLSRLVVRRRFGLEFLLRVLLSFFLPYLCRDSWQQLRLDLLWFVWLGAMGLQVVKLTPADWFAVL